MNSLNAMRSIKITSYLSKPTRNYLVEIPETATIFQLKQEIEKHDKISADWILLYNMARFGELKDNVIIANSRIEDERGVWAEFRYKFDESPPREG